MLITEELLVAGASAGGGYTRRQLELLGVKQVAGWKKAVIGTEISDEAAREFRDLAGSGSNKGKFGAAPVSWCGAATPRDIYLYVLELEEGRFYVGLSDDLDRRWEEHKSGAGAEWTKRYRPLRRIFTINTGTQDTHRAEAMEDEATITLMSEHGIERVRGGHFCQSDQAKIEANLRATGAWDRIKQAQAPKTAWGVDASWSDALDEFLNVAVQYYDAGAPENLRDGVFAASYRLTRYRFWREEFAPGLAWDFWSPKGVLPVLLSFKYQRPVSSRLPSSYDVLAAALNRGRGGNHPLRRLFLLTWKAYQPPTTDKQAATVERFMEYLAEDEEYDRRYDDFVSVLLPETRNLLRE
ncbi:GIY-YIG nuclease family protein [Burkholderia ubonensis]|uniref:GIY-YIG nuclease family protein n=1 Tax=Burkholderia ubonensis TaxID=101571 RepID=UPI0009B4348B|nr:GIY-YIG nuclease family protein [Burkholderia ubonensis]